MRKSIALGAFTALAAGSVGVGALDSVNGMVGSDTLKNLTTAVIDACPDLGTYPVDNDTSKAGNQPIRYDGTGSGNGENAMKPNPSAQWVAPMSRPLGTGICNAAAPRAGAEGIIMALDGVSIVMKSGLENADGIDWTGTTAGDNANNVWRTVLREVYTGMGASGSNLFARDCNSASRHAIVDNWDNLFKNTNANCTDSNPDAATTEPGLRHAFRRDEESGTTDVFLGQLSLPTVNFQQTAPGNSTVIPTGSDATQTAIYRALASSPFCNIRRPEDKYAPTNKAGSVIPVMYQVGLPAGAGGPPVQNQGLVPFDPATGTNARFLAPYMPEMQDEDPIRRKCFGSKQTIAASGSGPREEVCSADGFLGVVLPINPPPQITTAERYPNKPCEDTLDFTFGPSPQRPNGDPVRCPNGDAPQDGQCLLPVRTEGAGVAYDCINNGNNAPAAIFDSDGNGSDFPDAPNTDGRGDADGRAYNLILRKPDGTVRTIARPNPVALGSMNLPIVGAFYRIHTLRGGVAPVTDVCATQDDATDEIGCLVAHNACSIGYAGRGAVSNNAPNTVAALVNGVPDAVANIQSLVAANGSLTYPLSRKLYLNSIRGFETLLTSSDPAAPTGKDAELDLAECYANLPFSTFNAPGVNGTAQINVASPAFGFVTLPGATPKALCEDFNGKTGCADATNADACENNTGLIPTSLCNNGVKDGDETAPDVCPAARPTCDGTSHHCI